MKFKRLIIYILTLVLILISTITYASDNTTELDISSESVILIDSKTNTTLYEKNSEQKKYPASTTKVMTAILAIENCNNLNDKTIVKKDAISVIPDGYSSAYLSEGEEVTIRQLLEVLLVHSANDAGNVLAQYISGSIDEFVNLMNEKAIELGCQNTHFVNTNGIHNDDHYSTAKDLAIITSYCMKNQIFREIVAMEKCTIPKTNKSSAREYTNTNALINPDSNYYFEYCIGGKTGYTSEAKNCLISICNKDNLELIAVVLGSPKLPNSTASTRYSDSVSLFEYGYSHYEIKKIVSKNDVLYNLDIKNGDKETKNVDLILSDDISALMNVNNNNVVYTISLNDNLKAPISVNSIVGTVTYKVEENTYTQNLLASHDVVKKDNLILILGMILALILILLLILIIVRRRH